MDEIKRRTCNYYKKVFETAIDFINNNTSLLDSEKIDIHTHLISELTNNAQSINALDFALRCLPQSKTQEFMNVLNSNKVSTTFFKNITLIEDKIKKVRYEFECGIKIWGTEDVIKEKVAFYVLDEEKTKVELIDRIKKVESK